MIELHRLTPYEVLNTLVIQLSSCSYLALITLPHNKWFSLVNCNNHFIVRALNWISRFLIPKPPHFFHKWLSSTWPNDGLSSLSPCHKKFLLILFNQWLSSNGKQGHMYVGSESRTELIKVSLRPLDKYWVFHLASFFSHISITVS